MGQFDPSIQCFVFIFLKSFEGLIDLSQILESERLLFVFVQMHLFGQHLHFFHLFFVENDYKDNYIVHSLIDIYYIDKIPVLKKSFQTII